MTDSLLGRYFKLSASERRRRHLSGNMPKIAGDPQIRRFVTKALKTMTYNEIVEACRQKFGAPRAPSKSAVARYRVTLERVKRRRGGRS
jgi:hypothetical protein